MRRTTRRKIPKIRKLRKNKLTKRHKTLRVKRGGANDKIYKIKLKILNLLVNLLLNNLNQEDTTNLCMTINTNRTIRNNQTNRPKESDQYYNNFYQYDKLKTIHTRLELESKLRWNHQTKLVTYDFTLDDKTIRGILDALHHKMGVDCSTYFNFKEQKILLSADLRIGLGFILSNEPLNMNFLDSLLHTMFAVCIEYLKVVSINGTVAYNFDDFDCRVLKTKIEQTLGVPTVENSIIETEGIVGDSPEDIQNSGVRLKMLKTEKEILKNKLVDPSISDSDKLVINGNINRIDDTILLLEQVGNKKANEIMQSRLAIASMNK